MKKILISTKKKVNFLVKLFFDEVYVFSDNVVLRNKINKQNIKYISPDFVNLRENFSQENIASKFSKEILYEYIGEVPNLYPNKENYNFLYWDIKKYLSLEIAKYFKCEYLADKILDKEKIENYKIFIDPENLDYKTYKLLKKKNKIKYSIPLLSLVNFFFRSLIKSIVSFVYIILMPEIKFFLCKGESKKKLNFKIGYNIFFDQNFTSWHGSPDFFLKEGNFDKNDLAYIVNSRIQISRKKIKEHNSWINELKEKNYKIIDLNTIEKLISKKRYLQSVYPEIKKVRSFFLRNLKILNLININAANILSLNISWKIFFDLFYVKHFFSSMIYGENITNYLQSINSASTNFIYFSTTGELLNQKKFENHTEWIQYSYHKYDNFFGTKLSYEQFKNYENIFKNFYDFGNYSTSKISKTNKKELLTKLNIPANKMIISFFDDTVGFNSTQSFKGYEEYLDSIIKIINDDQEKIYLLKTKKDLNYYSKNLNNEISKKIQELKRSNKIYFFDGTFSEDINNKITFGAHDLISVSEVCVFSPMSSLSYDALCAKKKCIVFDPDKIYDHKKLILTRSELLYSQNHQELSHLLKYWQDSKNDYMVDILNERYIKPYIDKYCDDQTTERFTNYLNIN